MNKKTINKLIISSILSIFTLYSCSNEQLNNKYIEKSNFSKNKDYTIRGFADFEDTKSKFKIKSDNSITTRATVSLMYSNDYTDTSLRNTTIATGLTNEQGNFSINPDSNFEPIQNNVYILEAKKRIGGAGNSVISLRTNIKFDGTKWESISYPNITLNKKTTALSIISTLDPATMNPTESMNKVIYQNNVYQVLFNSKLTISRFNAVYKEVEKFIADLKDPAEEIFYISKTTGSINPWSVTATDSSIKANMHTLQTTLETYAVDWGGRYPQTIELLKQDAIAKRYWREINNPFRYYDSPPPFLPEYMNLSEYQQAKTTLNYKGNNLSDVSDLKGLVLYNPIPETTNSPNITSYELYGVDISGNYLTNDYKDMNSTPFVITNN